jgi:triacylglycerol esterase/lipase EstA (alpha/beta hydrolase family)
MHTSTRTVGERRRGGTRTHRGRLAVLALATLMIVPALREAPAGAGAPAARGTSSAPAALPIGGLTQALWNFVWSPGAVAGADNWHCRPSKAHPYPVVLVPATDTNLGMDFVAISPTLVNAGYCVFAFNYGMTWISLGRFGGLGDIAASARTMQAFVAKVLATTGAKQVDVVGHSQGGLMPNYYIKFLGGAAKVHTFVALAPSNHGTTLDGLATLGSELNLLGFVNSILIGVGTPGVVQQEQGSSFETALFAGGDTVPGPRYVVIETDHDEVVTPYQNAFLVGPNATDILLQDECPADPVGHIGLFDDGVALQDMLSALGSDHPVYDPTCTGYGIPY